MTRSALLIVDVQYDFLPGGALAIPDGDRVVPVINQLLASDPFDCVCATQDYHPPDHISFSDNHAGSQEEIDVEWRGVVQRQVLWPVHCVQDTHGCQLHTDLQTDKIDRTFRKGYNSRLDSYSGFADSFDHEETGLNKYLQEKAITRVYVVGLAEDYCVFQTALAAGRLHYETFIIGDAVAGIKPLTATQSDELARHRVAYIPSSSLLASGVES